MKGKTYLVPLCGLLLTASAVSSCRIVNGKVDFSLAEDRVSRPIADEVILESSKADLAAVPTPVPAPSLAEVAVPTPHAVGSLGTVPPLRPIPQGVMTPVTATTAKAGTYTVKKGDTLNRIAHAHGATPQALMAANKLASPDRLQVGMNLRIPAAGSAAAKTAALKPAATAKTAAKPAATKPAGHYVVKKGDTLYAVAARHKVTPAALMKANGLTPATAGNLKVGASLNIPASAR